jgi:hypothetical protein
MDLKRPLISAIQSKLQVHWQAHKTLQPLVGPLLAASEELLPADSGSAVSSKSKRGTKSIEKVTFAGKRSGSSLEARARDFHWDWSPGGVGFAVR